MKEYVQTVAILLVAAAILYSPAKQPEVQAPKVEMSEEVYRVLTAPQASCEDCKCVDCKCEVEKEVNLPEVVNSQPAPVVEAPKLPEVKEEIVGKLPEPVKEAPKPVAKSAAASSSNCASGNCSSGSGFFGFRRRR